MTSMWRDFFAAVVTALRHRPDERAIAEERRRAVQRLAEEKIREQRRETEAQE
ncbi:MULTISPECIES: hypothetical protein [Micromonospora]|uniref:hypothetical protein n=1 Tax=Micromonospora TaxID=1873 RepID=UPI0013151A0F|nr:MULTISPECIES: hypothetical protein [Micromonospora]